MTLEDATAHYEGKGMSHAEALAKAQRFMAANPGKVTGKPATTQTEARPEAKKADKAPVAPKPSPVVAAKVAPSPTGPQKARVDPMVDTLPDTVIGRAGTAQRDRDAVRDLATIQQHRRAAQDDEVYDFHTGIGKTDPTRRFAAMQQRQDIDPTSGGHAVASRRDGPPSLPPSSVARVDPMRQIDTMVRDARVRDDRPLPSPWAAHPMDYLGDAPAPKPIAPAPVVHAVDYDGKASKPVRKPEVTAAIEKLKAAGYDDAADGKDAEILEAAGNL